jgi:hypothetical protein
MSTPLGWTCIGGSPSPQCASSSAAQLGLGVSTSVLRRRNASVLFHTMRRLADRKPGGTT